MPISSLAASTRVVNGEGGTTMQTPLRSSTPEAHRVHWPMPVHSTQVDSHAVQAPVATLPNWPLGQKVVQLFPIRKGAPDPAMHAVHAIESPGAVQLAQVFEHGLQWPVEFAEKPAGQAARH